MAATHQETERLAHILKDHTAEWTERRTALASVRSIFAGTAQKSALLALATRLQGPLCVQLQDRRSIYCQEVCELIALIAQTLGEDFEELSEGYLAALLPLLMVTIAAICGPAHTSITTILPFATSCTCTIAQGVKDKHPAIRARCTEYMCSILENAPLLEKLNNESINAIDEGIRSAIGDSKPEARALAKRSFVVFNKRWPEHAQKLLAALDPTNQKRLQEPANKPAAPAKKPGGFAEFLAKKQAAAKPAPPAAATEKLVTPPHHDDDTDHPDGNNGPANPQSNSGGNSSSASSSSSSPTLSSSSKDSSSSPSATPAVSPSQNAAPLDLPLIPSPSAISPSLTLPSAPLETTPAIPSPTPSPVVSASPAISSPAPSHVLSASSSTPAHISPVSPTPISPTPKDTIAFQPLPVSPVLQDATNTVPVLEKPAPNSASESPVEKESSPPLVSRPKRTLAATKTTKSKNPPVGKTIVKPVRATKSRLVALTSSDDKENVENADKVDKPASKKLKVARGPVQVTPGSTPIAARVKTSQRAAAITARRAFKL